MPKDGEKERYKKSEKSYSHCGDVGWLGSCRQATRHGLHMHDGPCVMEPIGSGAREGGGPFGGWH